MKIQLSRGKEKGASGGGLALMRWVQAKLVLEVSGE